MKHATRAMALFLCGLLLSASLLSCSGNTPAEDTAAPDTTAETNAADTTTAETELTDGLTNVDMDGFALRFLHTASEGLSWAEVRLDATVEESADILSEALYKRSVMLGERFNASLKISEEDGHAKTATTYINLVSSGDDSVDIALIYGIRVPLVLAYVQDFAKLPHISLDEAWWTPNSSAPFYIGDKQVAAAGSFSLAYASTANLYAFNKDLYKDMNTGEDLYDVVREGKWTLDKFFTLSAAAVKDIDGDGVIGTNDQNGFAGGFSPIHTMMSVGSHVQYIARDEDNYPLYNLNADNKAVEVIGKIVSFHVANPHAYDWPETLSKGNTDKFPKGLLLFAQSTPKLLTDFREMEDEFGVIPCPKYDEAQEEYYCSMSNGELSTLPRTARTDRLENIGILLEAMSFYTHKEILPVYRDVVLDMKVSRDEDSAEMLDIIFAGATYDLGINVFHTDLNGKINSDIYWTKNEAIVSYLTSLKPTLDGTIQALKETIKAMP